MAVHLEKIKLISRDCLISRKASKMLHSYSEKLGSGLVFYGGYLIHSITKRKEEVSD